MRLAWSNATVNAMARLSERIERLEGGQRETNVHLVAIDGHLTSIDATLHTASRLFELMHGRLEHLEEGQKVVVDRLERLDAGQKLVVERLDRLVEATTRERTMSIERLARIEQRLDVVEEKL